MVQATIKPTLVIVIGPTAVGKTEIGIQLAEQMDGEIISADSRLFYRGLDIGTAKPTRAERERVRHHLIDIADPDEIIGLVEFQRRAREAIAEVHSGSKLPFLVGGTGQYVRAVIEGWIPPELEQNSSMRTALENLRQNRGSRWLHEKLSIMDPGAAAQIDARNARRTIRALEVIMLTGRKYTDQRGKAGSSYSVIPVGLNRPRAELYVRIDARIERMFEEGLLQEVKRLLAKGYTSDLPSMSAIGYRECIKILQNEWDVETAKAEIKRLTRIFVRRQSNWFRRNDPQIHWFEAGDPGVITEIATFINHQRQGIRPTVG